MSPNGAQSAFSHLTFITPNYVTLIAAPYFFGLALRHLVAGAIATRKTRAHGSRRANARDAANRASMQQVR